MNIFKFLFEVTNDNTKTTINSRYKVVKIFGIPFGFHKKVKSENQIFTFNNEKIEYYKICKIPGSINGKNNVIYIKNIEEFESKNCSNIIINGNDNSIYINDIKEFKNKKCLEIIINGNNNNIEINSSNLYKSNFDIEGNDNKIIIESKVKLRRDNFYVHSNNSKIFIDKDTTIADKNVFRIRENNSEIIIGKDCMFSWNVSCFATDSHIIRDLETDEIINKGNFVRIKDHVWIGCGATICKNVEINENNVIGTQSVVTKSVQESNVAIAGNPAKIVKRNIYWERDSEG